MKRHLAALHRLSFLAAIAATTAIACSQGGSAGGLAPEDEDQNAPDPPNAKPSETTEQDPAVSSPETSSAAPSSSAEPSSSTQEESTGIPSASSSEPVTWFQDIAPLVHEHCGSCHNDSGIAPFSLLTYERAAPLAELMLEEIEALRMPPWGARETEECSPPHDFRDDLTLTEAERTAFASWVASGTPMGDRESAVAVPELPSLQLDDSSLSFGIDQEIAIDGDEDQFYCFSIDPGFEQDVWLTASQIRPGNSEIVHHVLVFVDNTGASAELAGEDGHYPCFGGPMLARPQLIGVWAPGALPWRTPAGSAMHVPAGARLVLNVHYHPNGQLETDRDTEVQLETQSEEPDETALIALVGNFSNAESGLLPGPNDRNDQPEFRIPAGVADHVEMLQRPVDVPLIALGARVWSVGTHMHLLGRDMKMSLARADGSELCLVQTPDWNFDWQRAYTYDIPADQGVPLELGDVVSMRCTYDNTMNHPGTVTALAEQGLDAPVDVYLGEGSLDEMCLGLFGLTIPGAWSIEDILSRL